ncbi:hypothetical protein EVAR_17517_1 [Eumeta japonica]|uniref:Uncharacterized protein n=1 Tax=Eumeta variegata TaxID=151549 RepID=A0A4C1WSA5_EUMVA|nr:hypothetical protein EVAR_17517_1 [Eumeta japonica]
MDVIEARFRHIRDSAGPGGARAAYKEKAIWEIPDMTGGFIKNFRTRLIRIPVASPRLNVTADRSPADLCERYAPLLFQRQTFSGVNSAVMPDGASRGRSWYK